MQNLFKVDSPYLTYHLDSLRDLVSKTEDGRYRLTTMGESALALMRGVEETPRIIASRHRSIGGGGKMRRVVPVLFGILSIIGVIYTFRGWHFHPTFLPGIMIVIIGIIGIVMTIQKSNMDVRE